MSETSEPKDRALLVGVIRQLWEIVEDHRASDSPPRDTDRLHRILAVAAPETLTP